MATPFDRLAGQLPVELLDTLTELTNGISSTDIADGSVTTAKLAASAVTKAKAGVFLSVVQFANGGSQNVPHGLGVTPTLVLIVPTGGHNGAGAAGTQFPTIAAGVHTSTNAVATVTQGAEYRVFAWV